MHSSTRGTFFPPIVTRWTKSQSNSPREKRPIVGCLYCFNLARSSPALRRGSTVGIGQQFGQAIAEGAREPIEPGGIDQADVDQVADMDPIFVSEGG